MTLPAIKTAILHYSAPPVTGGVEAVLAAHAQVLLAAGYPVSVVAGQAEEPALPRGTKVVVIPEMDAQAPDILEINACLEQGQVPENFHAVRERLARALRPVLREQDVVIAHNVLTTHFNLPLTAAIFNLIEDGSIRRCLAWCHDVTWDSPNTRSKVFPGYPWDLPRTYHPRVEYVAVSEQRQREMMKLLEQPAEKIPVIYNGVEPVVWYGLTPEGWGLVQRLKLLSGDLILLMPVRVTQAKNIELAVRVASALKQAGCSPRMVVTGPPDTHSPDSMRYYRGLLDLRDRLGLQDEMRFVYEAGDDPGDPYLVSQKVIADLLRVADILFMPSHREGFGMPVLEAGLIGVPAVVSDRVPAAKEVGGKNVYLFSANAAPDEIARLVLKSVSRNRSCRFRQQVRQNFTWERIFRQKLEPLLRRPAP